MTLQELKLIKAFIRNTEAVALQTIQKVYLNHLSKKTGTLFESIQAHMIIDCRADKVIFILFRHTI